MIFTTLFALMVAPLSWQFSAGIMFSEIIGYLDFRFGKSPTPSPELRSDK